MSSAPARHVRADHADGAASADSANQLEEAADHFEHATNVVETIAVKES